MTLSLHIVFDQDLPVPLPRDLDQIIRWTGRITQPNKISIYEIERDEWREIFNVLRDCSLCDIRGYPRIVDRRQPSWDPPPSDYCAAVLGPADTLPALNDEHDYEPRLPTPCRGYLKPHVAAVTRTRPLADFLAIGDDFFFSKRLAKALGLSREMGGIVHRGQVSSKWARYDIGEIRSVLSPDSLGAERQCALCSGPFIAPIGVWISRSAPEDHGDVFADQLGSDHLAMQHPILISLDLARPIAKMYSRGVILQPVYASSSRTAEIVRFVRKKAQEMLQSRSTS